MGVPRSSWIFLACIVYVCLAMEPIKFEANRTSRNDRAHLPSTSWPQKYLNDDTVVVKIPPRMEQSIDQLAESHGFVNKGPLAKLPHYYIWVRNKSIWRSGKEGGRTDRNVQKPLSETFSLLDNSPHVEWWDYMKPRERVKRGVNSVGSLPLKRGVGNSLGKRDDWTSPHDPNFSQQWHLRGSHLDVINVWKDRGVSGAGVNLAIVDDGLQREHPDLAPNFRSDLSWDFNDDDSDPEPSRQDGHGTSAAGVAGASEDNHCGVGVAPDVNLVGLRLLGSWTSDADEARALCHLCDEEDPNKMIQIYSNSWGPSDDGKIFGGPGPLTVEAFQYCTQHGRRGKGSIYVWAGGNGRYNGDDSNYDGYANSRFTIAISAVDVNGVYTWYSESGANILCSAPSSGYQGSSITTTDLLSNWGYSRGGCTDSFGGTSAAAPQIAGVVALLLEARPELSWRDVQHVLVRGSRSTDNRNTIWTTNAAGFVHSHDYGFGLVDADEAVSIALNWKLLSDNQPCHVTSRSIVPNARNTQIVSKTTKKYIWTISQDDHDANAIQSLEHVSVSVVLDVPNKRRCLDLTLIGPSGVESILHSSEAVHATETSLHWTFDTVRHWGEKLYHQGPFQRFFVVKRNPLTPSYWFTRSSRGLTSRNGTWTLRVRDVCYDGPDNQQQYPKKVGGMKLNEWRLDFYGEGA